MLDKLTSWLQSTGLAALDRILPFLLILFGGLIVIRIVLSIVNKALERSKLEKAAHSLIRSVLRVLLYILLALMAASSLGIDVTGIVALASVASLALSLALQNSLSNVIGGFILLYTRPFRSGDYVEIAGQSGTVQEIGMAYTKLTTPDNKLISIPNSAVVAAQIVNYTVTGTRRVEVAITAPYCSEPQRVLAALKEAGNVPQALPEQGINAFIVGYNERTISYSLRIWTKTEVYWDAWFLMNENVQAIFAREGLSLSKPTVTVKMDKE